MPQIKANGINIEYEVTGPTDGPAILLVMGLAGQMTFWPDAFIQNLNEAGYRTIRFDNRDIGHSEKITNRRTPNVLLQLFLRRFGVRGLSAYTLMDMAKDAVGLMDALDIEKAHIVGVSMGGMISQIIAGEFPNRTLSLTAIMTTTNRARLPGPKGDVSKLLFSAPKRPLTREEVIERSLWGWSVISTKDSGSTPEEVRARIEANYDRGHYPPGPRRQLSAIIETGDIRRYTRRVHAPTLVIHGRVDPLIPVEGGMDVARCAPYSELKIIEDMAHDVPKKHVDTITGWMTDHYDIVHKRDRNNAAA